MRMFGPGEKRVQRLTDAAVAEELVAGRFPDGDALKELRMQVEVAADLADLADNDPETVYVVGCSRELTAWGGHGLGGYLVLGRVSRTIARPDQRVALIVCAGVLREEALVRLAHIRAHLMALPAGTVLAPEDDGCTAEANRAARLDAARRIVLQENEAARERP
jgi:hypothetical protein